MKTKKPQKLINPKKIAQKIKSVADNHAHTKIAVSDLNKYEKMMYATIRTVFENGTLDDLQQPLYETYILVAREMIEQFSGFEKFTLDEPWVDIYTEVITPFIDVFVPGLISLLKETNEPLTKERALVVAVTETTRLQSICFSSMTLTYNNLIDELWG